MNYHRALRSAAAATATVAALALVAACGSDSESDSANDPATSAATPTEGTSASSLSITDPWVKSAESGMSAAFGTLVNDGDQDVTVVSATSAATTTMELHETLMSESGEMVMQPKEDGFTVPAGGSLELAPGGNHLMFMDLTAPLLPGEDVTITLTLSDGSTTDVVATVKDFDGANEEYQGDMEMDMDETDMSESQ